MKKLFAILLLVLLAGCSKNTTDENLVGTRCIAGTERTWVTMMPMSCGNGCMTMMPITNSTCDYESYIYKNPDYIPPEQRKP